MYRILLILAFSALIPIFAGCFEDSAGPEAANIPSVKICEQVWMQKNLDVSHYRNGDTIPEIRDTEQWAKLKTGAWCYYNNDPANGAIYGKLYNWYAVNDPRGLAPKGWHVPSDEEWTELVVCLGGDSAVGGKLKEKGYNFWKFPNESATNESGFSALPGGWRGGRDDGNFGPEPGYIGCWYSSTLSDSLKIWGRTLNYNHGNIFRLLNYKEHGFSVRCVRDN